MIRVRAVATVAAAVIVAGVSVFSTKSGADVAAPVVLSFRHMEVTVPPAEAWRTLPPTLFPDYDAVVTRTVSPTHSVVASVKWWGYQLANAREQLIEEIVEAVAQLEGGAGVNDPVARILADGVVAVVAAMKGESRSQVIEEAAERTARLEETPAAIDPVLMAAAGAVINDSEVNSWILASLLDLERFRASSGRKSLLSFDSDYYNYDAKSGHCVGFMWTAEDRGVTEFEGLPFALRVAGSICTNSDFGLISRLTYSERYHPSEQPLATFDQELRDFLLSLRLLSMFEPVGAPEANIFKFATDSSSSLDSLKSKSTKQSTTSNR